jgi:RimJ/RimL family protein N-acetyltransferase
MSENAASLRIFQKNGYQQIGRIPQRWWKRGGYQDSVLLALQRSDWKP